MNQSITNLPLVCFLAPGACCSTFMSISCLLCLDIIFLLLNLSLGRRQGWRLHSWKSSGLSDGLHLYPISHSTTLCLTPPPQLFEHYSIEPIPILYSNVSSSCKSQLLSVRQEYLHPDTCPPLCTSDTMVTRFLSNGPNILIACS